MVMECTWGGHGMVMGWSWDVHVFFMGCLVMFIGGRVGHNVVVMG